MRVIALFLLLLIGASSAHRSTVLAAPPRDQVEWFWDEKSPSAVVLKTEGPTYKIIAKGRVQFKKGIVIENARFLVYYGGDFEMSWNIEPEVLSPATVGAVTDVDGDKELAFRTVTSDPLILEKATFSVPANIRLKVVARITYKLKATGEKEYVGLFELPGYVTTPGK